jgi:membrane-bound lytic murein transglycosylase MltF
VSGNEQRSELEHRYDSLIQYACTNLGRPGRPINWLLVKAMVQVGSNFNPAATTVVGRGLMGLPESVSQEYKIKQSDNFNPEMNVEIGVLHLRKLLYRLCDLPAPEERYACALAAYVSSLEYVSKSLAQARDVEGLPSSYKAWRTESGKPGRWQRWLYVKDHLLPWSVELPYEPARVVGYVEDTLGVYRAYRNGADVVPSR